MLNGREAVGNTNFSWSEFAFGKGKTRRKCWGFGTYNKKERSWSDYEVYIRELSIVEGALGCAVWDAGVILSRWIYDNKATFGGKSVLELGSGCGLPGIVVARYAKDVVLTDYLPQILENLSYNVKLNSGEFLDEDEEESENKSFQKLDNIKIRYLNWDEIDGDATQGEKIEAADIIMGSELTYSPKSVYTLIKVIDKFMKPDGVFYEVLSDDRDGVSLFLEEIAKAGYEYAINPVPEKYLGNFNTGQRPETYKFYTFKRKGCLHPDMK